MKQRSKLLIITETCMDASANLLMAILFLSSVFAYELVGKHIIRLTRTTFTESG